MQFLYLPKPSSPIETLHGHVSQPANTCLQYSGKENEGLESGIDKGVLAFVDLIERNYMSAGTEFKPMDFARKAQYLTLDIITDLAFGQSFGYLAQDTDIHDYIKITEDSMPVMMVLTVIPALARLMQSKYLRRLMPSEHDRVGFGKFIG